MSTILELNCWVLGDDATRIFPVCIGTGASVYALKELIKEKKKPELNHLATDSLDLWKVTIPIDGNLRQNLRNVNLVDEESLFPLELSEVFTDPPPRRHIHVIVRPLRTAIEQSSTLEPHVVPEPNLELYCLFQGEDANSVFLVRIKLSEHVYDLKKAIQRERKDLFEEVSAVKLMLWKTSVPIDNGLGQAIRDTNFTHEEQLGAVRLSKVFPIPPPPEHVHIVVKVDDLDMLRDIRVRSYKRLPSGAPSDLGDPANFFDYQEELKSERPLEASRDIPPMLIHPIFGEFIDDCERHVPEREDNMLAYDLRTHMSQIFGPESDRLSGFVQILRRHGIEACTPEMESEGSAHRTNADVQVNGFRFVIIESKNEISSDGAEPLFQAMWRYQRSVGGDDKIRMQIAKYPNSPLPCLLLYVLGPHIGFAGAVYTDCPHVQTLSILLPLFYHRTDSGSQLNAARHVGALKNAIAKLRRYYEVELPFLSRPSISHQNLNVLYPYPSEFTSLRHPSESTHHSTYRRRMGGKLVFEATLANGDLICVKFVQTYSREAHEECTKLHCAPVLHGFKRLPGDWFMVVMDYLDDDRYHLPDDSDLSDELYEAMKSSLAKLHEVGFVHGKICALNTMVKNDDPSKFMLLGFDWAGKIGEAQYPPYACMVAQNLQSPDDDYVVDGQPILAEHDMKMLDVMFRTKPKDAENQEGYE